MAIMIGSILGGPESLNTSYFSIKRLLQERMDKYIEVNKLFLECDLDIVFHVSGTVYQPNFVGIRTGSYSNSEKKLQVQIAVNNNDLNDATLFRSKVAAAILVGASSLYKKKRIASICFYEKVSDYLKS